MNSVDRAIHHVFGLTVTGVLGVWWWWWRRRRRRGGEGEESCRRSWGYRGERMGVDDSALSSTRFHYPLFCTQE